MRHRLKTKKLNRTHSHRISLMRNATISLIKNDGSIKISLAIAKSLRKFVEPLITYGKNNYDKQNVVMRYLCSKLNTNTEIAKKIITLSDKYKNRPGGYTRIIKYGYRNNDRMPLSIIQFV